AELRAEIEESFERLRAERIPLLYLHRVHAETDIEEPLRVLAELVEAGRVEHIGLSEVSAEQVARAQAVAPIAAVQNEYNLGERRWDAVIDHCEASGILFVPFYPLRAGAGRGRGSPRRHRDAGQAGLAARPLALRGADPGHALARAPEGEPRGARPRARRGGPGRARLSRAGGGASVRGPRSAPPAGSPRPSAGARTRRRPEAATRRAGCGRTRGSGTAARGRRAGARLGSALPWLDLRRPRRACLCPRGQAC